MTLAAPWTDRAIKTNWSRIEQIAAEENLPLPVRLEKKWKFEEYGCGHYGCVMPTSRKDIVFKITSDPTEAGFIEKAHPLGWPEGIVEYHAIIPLAATYRKRDVFAIWREAAFAVGALGAFRVRRNEYEERSEALFLLNLARFKDHAARFRDSLKNAKDREKRLQETEALEQWAWDNVGLDEANGQRHSGHYRPQYRFLDGQRGAYRLASSWRACEIIAETMENTYLSDLVGGALSYFMEKGILLADVHHGNIGRASREDYSGDGPWVITDPGHAVFV